MTVGLAFDTETTGPNPTTAHLVQLGASFFSVETGEELAWLEAVVQPYYAERISDEAAGVHGVTHERAVAEGRSLGSVLDWYLALRNLADVLVAHNAEYDATVLWRAVRAAGRSYLERPGLRLVCTKELASPITRLPPTARMVRWGRGHQFKDPTLAEACRGVLGREPSGAHTALADARDARDVYLELRRRGSAR